MAPDVCIRSFIRLFRSFIDSFVHSFIRSFFRSLIGLFIQSFIDSINQLTNQSINHAFIIPFIIQISHSLHLSLLHPFRHLFSHALISCHFISAHVIRFIGVALAGARKDSLVVDVQASKRPYAATWPRTWRENVEAKSLHLSAELAHIKRQYRYPSSSCYEYGEGEVLGFDST